MPVCTATVRRVLQSCQALAEARCAEAFILCVLQCDTGILYWSGREKSHSTSPSTTFPTLLYALRHGRRQPEPSAKQSATEPAEHGTAQAGCYSLLLKPPGRRMRSHSSVFSRC